MQVTTTHRLRCREWNDRTTIRVSSVLYNQRHVTIQLSVVCFPLFLLTPPPTSTSPSPTAPPPPANTRVDSGWTFSCSATWFSPLCSRFCPVISMRSTGWLQLKMMSLAAVQVISSDMIERGESCFILIKSRHCIHIPLGTSVVNYSQS